MGLDRCLFAVQLAPGLPPDLVQRRLAQVEALYGACGEVDLSLRAEPGARALYGMLRVGGPAAPDGVASWGAEPPAAYREAGALAGLPPAQLRRLPGSIALLDASAGRVVLAAGPGGMQALFRADGEGVTAWSTHALAASWLATGGAELDPDGIAELLCWEFPGGSRTLLYGTRALPAATRVELHAAGAGEAAYASMEERWRPLPAADAHELAERRLLEHLGASLAAAADPVLGLTAGVDSRTLAVALRELGIRVRALTYVGDAAALHDAEGAAAVAQHLRLDHEVVAVLPHDPRAGLGPVRAEAVWSDGALPAGCAGVRWPALSHWVTGVGAGVGRAFYYRWLGSPRPGPQPRDLLAPLFADMDLDLGGADPEVRRRLRATVAEWLAEAESSGHRGWALLDVLYGEQRARRWARAMTPRIDAHHVPGFAAQPLMQARASLPLDDRLDEGFARRFVASRAPELVPGRPLRPGGRPGPLARRRAVLAARAARRALRLPPLGRAPEEPWYRRAPWSERPDLVEWLADGVLRSPLLERALGAGWQRETRRNFVRGEPHAAYLAAWAAGPVALAEAVQERAGADPARLEA